MTKVIGLRERFAVEFSVNPLSQKKQIGTLLFWANNQPIGDASDQNVDLSSCFFWMSKAVVNAPSRFEVGLYEMPAEEVFTLLASSVLVDADPKGVVSEVFDDTFLRFHISHCGMSSFDSFTLLLVESVVGQQRLIWKDWRATDVPLYEAFFEPKEVTNVFLESVSFWDEKMGEKS